MKEENESIYKLKLHDFIQIGKLIITRVAGGWIYEVPRGNTNRYTATFVPFDNEFMLRE